MIGGLRIMVEDNPRMDELEELVQFCHTYRNIYIYGHGESQRLLSKYLVMSQIKISGFIVPEILLDDYKGELLPVVNILSVKLPKWRKKADTGIIISVNECRYSQAIDLLQKAGFVHFYFISEWNKRTIPHKMRPRIKENFLLEVNLADHCNLNCQCCDHFSPLAPPTFLNFDQYVKDIQRLAELTNHHIGLMKLQGGEPLLNERLIEYIKVTREVFPNTYICIFTDGLLLSKWENNSQGNLWEAIKQYEIEVRVTCYPIPLDVEKIKKQVLQYGIPIYTESPPYGKEARIWFLSEIGDQGYRGIKHSVKHPFDLTGRQEPFRFISCYQFNESIVLRDGKIYTCPMIPYVHYFNDYFGVNLQVSEEDYIDIYHVNNYEEIAEFCTQRAPFCRFCAVHCRTSREWKQSGHLMEEWV